MLVRHIVLYFRAHLRLFKMRQKPQYRRWEQNWGAMAAPLPLSVHFFLIFMHFREELAK